MSDENKRFRSNELIQISSNINSLSIWYENQRTWVIKLLSNLGIVEKAALFYVKYTIKVVSGRSMYKGDWGMVISILYRYSYTLSCIHPRPCSIMNTR